MSNWEVTKKSESNHIVDIGMELLSGAKPPSDYTVRNTETGEEKEVTAINNDHLAAKIERGQFKK